MTEGHGTDHTATVLLVLYEFEAKARLGGTNLEEVLEKALLLPQVEPKAFETMAGASKRRSYTVRCPVNRTTHRALHATHREAR